eukprot:TRINITY_DN27_c0_g1_i7.p1 TRINITY_DN27_c0_g1~~TRINITY_DN27_c0_g1_i7.p1  ORF type:complete len:234 (+),score=51.86 TRINITY_DN27_c0_g1_i7:26-703(+)
MATTFRGAPPTLSLSPPTASDQRLVMALAARFSTAASSLVFHASCEKIPTVLSSAASTTASTATQFTTSVQRNANIAKLQAGYLFPEIKRRRDAHLQKNPDANIISLGIGDTTEPIPLVISEAMAEAMADLVEFYKENARILKDTFESLGYKALGGENAPYVWVEFPGKSSWDVFEEILTQANVVTTPGSGFGPGGEGFVRASAFGHRKNILEASQRLKELLGKR